MSSTEKNKDKVVETSEERFARHNRQAMEKATSLETKKEAPKTAEDLNNAVTVATEKVEETAKNTIAKTGPEQVAAITLDTEKTKEEINRKKLEAAEKIAASDEMTFAKNKFDAEKLSKAITHMEDELASLKNANQTPDIKTQIQDLEHRLKEAKAKKATLEPGHVEEDKAQEIKTGAKEENETKKTPEQVKTAVQEAVTDKKEENEEKAEKTAEELAKGDPAKKEGFLKFLTTKTKDWWKNASTMQRVIAVGGIGGSLAIAGFFGGAAAVAGSGLSILGTKIGKAYLDRERTKETKEKGLAGHIMEWYDKQPEGKKRVLSILAMTTAGATLSVAGGGLAGFVGAGKSMGLDAVSNALLTKIGRGVASGFSGEATRKVAEKAFGGKLEDKIKSIEAQFATEQITEEQKNKLINAAKRNFAIRDAIARMTGAFAGGYAYGHATEWGHNIGEKVFHHNENGADNVDPKPIGGGPVEHINDQPQYESKYLPAIEVHDGEGGLSVAKRMHELVLSTYAGVDESHIPPEYLKIMKTSPTELAKAFDFYRPGHEAESMMFNKGATISFGQDSSGHFNVQLSNIRDIDGQVDNQWLFKEEGTGTIDGTDEERVLGREMGLGGADNERYFDANKHPKIIHNESSHVSNGKIDASNNEDILIGKTDPNETIGTSDNENILIGKTDPNETIDSLTSKDAQPLEVPKTDPNALLGDHIDQDVSENGKVIKKGITGMENGYVGTNKYPNASSGSGFQPPISMYHETKDYANSIGQGQYQDQHRYDGTYGHENQAGQYGYAGQTLEQAGQENAPSSTDFYHDYINRNAPDLKADETLQEYFHRLHPSWDQEKINSESEKLIEKAAKYAKKAAKSMDPVVAQRKAKAGSFFGNLFGGMFGGNNNGNNGSNNHGPNTGFGDGGWGYGQSNQNGGYYNDGSSKPNMMKPG